VKFYNGNVHPLIFRQVSIADGLPKFDDAALQVNDFPAASDKSLAGNKGAFFSKMLTEKKIMYTASGPTGDYDNDGRLDMFLPNWWPEAASMLLKNNSNSGNFLKIKVEGAGKVNRMGVGARIRIYPAGKLGNAAALIGNKEISVGFGYGSGQAPIVHAGLGKLTKVDLEVILPHGNGTLIQKGITANQTIIMKK
jgi:enediyne biosynthesis protein E4